MGTKPKSFNLHADERRRGGACVRVFVVSAKAWAALIVCAVLVAGCSKPAPVRQRPALPIVRLPLATVANGKIAFTEDKVAEPVPAGKRTQVVCEVRGDETLDAPELHAIIFEVKATVPGPIPNLVDGACLAKRQRDGDTYRFEGEMGAIKKPGNYRVTAIVSGTGERQESCELVVK